MRACLVFYPTVFSFVVKPTLMQVIKRSDTCATDFYDDVMEVMKKQELVLRNQQKQIEKLEVEMKQLPQNINYKECESGWVKFKMSCYYLSTDVLTREDAKTRCEQIQEKSKYVRITTEEEDTFLKNQALSQKLTHAANQADNDSPDFWIGGTDSANESVFMWSGYSMSFTYTNWGPNNPDNNNGKQHCVILFQRSNYKWHDTECSNRNRYICEM